MLPDHQENQGVELSGEEKNLVILSITFVGAGILTAEETEQNQNELSDIIRNRSERKK